jgi:hypothetical protein
VAVVVAVALVMERVVLAVQELLFLVHRKPQLQQLVLQLSQHQAVIRFIHLLEAGVSLTNDSI